MFDPSTVTLVAPVVGPFVDTALLAMSRTKENTDVTLHNRRPRDPTAARPFAMLAAVLPAIALSDFQVLHSAPLSPSRIEQLASLPAKLRPNTVTTEAPVEGTFAGVLPSTANCSCECINERLNDCGCAESATTNEASCPALILPASALSDVQIELSAPV
jgi:hypothetical protein